MVDSLSLRNCLVIILFLPSLETAQAAPLGPLPAMEPIAQSLTLREASEQAVQNNITVRLAQAADESAQAKVLESAAALLPNLTAGASQNRIFRDNLAARGFPPNGPIPSLIGPYNNFDLRLQLVQNLFDLGAFKRREAGSKSVSLSRLEEDLTRDQVRGAATLAYIEALRAGKANEAAQADFELAGALLKLAQDRKSAGVSTEIDVVRNQTRLAQAKLKLLEVESAKRQAHLRLKRVIGLSLNAGVTLTEPFEFHPQEPPEEEQAVAWALRERLEPRIAQLRYERDSINLKAAEAAALPSLALNGNYGLSGNLPDSQARATGGVGIALKMSLWNGGLTKAAKMDAGGLKDRSLSLFEDTRAQVEQDARLAVQSLATAQELVKTSDQSLELAQKELNLARDRFSEGVGENIELVTAQTALAWARNAQVEALAQFHISRVNLAMALGRIHEFNFSMSR